MAAVGNRGTDCLKIDSWYFSIAINTFMKNFQNIAYF